MITSFILGAFFMYWLYEREIEKAKEDLMVALEEKK